MLTKFNLLSNDNHNKINSHRIINQNTDYSLDNETELLALNYNLSYNHRSNYKENSDILSNPIDNINYDSNKILLNHKNKNPDISKSDRIFSEFKSNNKQIDLNSSSQNYKNYSDSFESKVNEVNNNPDVKDELMITLNPQMFKYNLWSESKKESDSITDTPTDALNQINYNTSHIKRDC